jgi:hypothetical protein
MSRVRVRGHLWRKAAFGLPFFKQRLGLGIEAAREASNISGPPWACVPAKRLIRKLTARPRREALPASGASRGLLPIGSQSLSLDLLDLANDEAQPRYIALQPTHTGGLGAAAECLGRVLCLLELPTRRNVSTLSVAFRRPESRRRPHRRPGDLDATRRYHPAAAGPDRRGPPFRQLGRPRSVAPWSPRARRPENRSPRTVPSQCIAGSAIVLLILALMWGAGLAFIASRDVR